MLTQNDIDWTISIEPMEEGPEGFFALGDDNEDQAICEKIRADWEFNDWAWCTVKVTGEWEGLTFDDYLGACSYRSESDFIENSGYYEDMQAEITAELNRHAARIAVNYG